MFRVAPHAVNKATSGLGTQRTAAKDAQPAAIVRSALIMDYRSY